MTSLPRQRWVMGDCTAMDIVRDRCRHHSFACGPPKKKEPMPKLSDINRTRIRAAVATYPTQRAAALDAEVPEPQLSEILNGDAGASEDTLERMAKAWGMTYDHHPEKIMLGKTTRKKYTK